MKLLPGIAVFREIGFEYVWECETMKTNAQAIGVYFSHMVIGPV